MISRRIIGFSLALLFLMGSTFAFVTYTGAPAGFLPGTVSADVALPVALQDHNGDGDEHDPGDGTGTGTGTGSDGGSGSAD